MSGERLDKFLLSKGYYESRARATSAIKAGRVKINGKIAKKPSLKIADHDHVEASDEHPWVSRGGIKLAYALDIFGVDPLGRICLDIGSSTGGFTHVLLENGASRIYAVDVGRDQLHVSLRSNERVRSMEMTDARELHSDMFDPLPTLIVCDASFIAAAKVLAVPMGLVASGAELISLVKPQFEVGRANIGKGGLVKDPALAQKSLEDFQLWAESQGWHVKVTANSPITGGDGNREFLIHAVKI